MTEINDSTKTIIECIKDEHPQKITTIGTMLYERYFDFTNLHPKYTYKNDLLVEMNFNKHKEHIYYKSANTNDFTLGIASINNYGNINN